MSQLKLKKRGKCVDGVLTGKAMVITTKKTCWEKIIDFFKKLFGIS